MPEPKIVYLVDASMFIHRSYHAIRNLSTRDGMPTNAIFGFTATIHKLLKDKKPERIAVVYDAKGPSFRKEIYPDYKANRPPMPEDLIAQQEPIRRIVAALGLPGIEVPGLEADDIIAALTRKALKAGYNVVIVAGDKDYYQLLSPRVSMYDPNPKRESAMTKETFTEKFNLSPAAFLEVQGLMGDSTDNIPGIPGVGEKTAVKLIQQFGTLEALYEGLDQLPANKLKEKLIEHKDSAFLSRDLARLKSDAEIDTDPVELIPSTPDRETLVSLYQSLEFTRFLSDLGPEKTVDYDDYHLVTSEENLVSIMAELAAAPILSVDLETTSLDPMRAEIVGVSLSGALGRAFYLPIGHTTLDADQLPWETAAPHLKTLLESEKPGKVGQNIKYDYLILRRHGIEVRPIEGDSMIASYLLDPGAGGHGLDNLSLTYLGHDTIKFKEVVGSKQAGFQDVMPEAAKEYACEDADVALRLVELLHPKLDELNLSDIYKNLEIPLIHVLAGMEMTGVRLDMDFLNDLSKEWALQLEGIEERIYALAGHKFNINSTRQLGEILFEELKLPQIKKTRKKTQYSTDVEVLTELAAQHELPAEMLNYRQLTKLRGTYVDALAQLVHPETGRVHTSFHQAVTATGRLSSSDPNLQNIPIRSEEGRRIRRAFIAEPGWKLLSADYSQVELRVLAHYSRDPGLQDAFHQGDDIHTRTAAEVFGLMPAMVDADMRREAKAINFGLVYGQQAFGLSRQLGIEVKQAQAYIDTYFQRYSGVKDFMDQTLEQARRDGYVTTLMGRRRNLPELNSKNYQARSMAERMAINTPIQGSAADLIKKAMIDLARALAKSRLKAKMLLQVHDELIFEVPENEIEETAALVKEKMENALPLDVPLIVDIGQGDNWAEAH